MKKIAFTAVNLVINSVQVRTQDQVTSAPGATTPTVEKVNYLNVSGVFPELGNLGFYKDFPITDTELAAGNYLALAEKFIKADFAKTTA